MGALMGLIAELFMAAGMAIYHGVRKSFGLGPTRRQMERWCDGRDLAYSPENFAKARESLARGIY